MSPGFFVDESDLGLGKRLSRQWPGVVYPGHPNIPGIPRGSLFAITERALREVTL